MIFILRYKLIIFLILISACFLISCKYDKATNTRTNEVEFTQINTNPSINQELSNQAKKLISNMEEVSKVNAVNTKDQLLLTFEIDHLQRLQLKKIKKKVEQKLNEKMKEQTVTV